MAPPAAIAEVPAPHARRRWLLTGLVALAVVVAGEGAARHLAPHLPAPDLWADTATATKVAQLDHIAHEQGCVDVLFLGSSMARDGLDPGRFTAADPLDRTAYNASLDAAGPALLRRWIEGTVLPRVDTATVVIGVASFDLNERARIVAAALAAHRDAPYSADGAANELEAWVIRHSALVRHRAALRDPEELTDALGRWRRGERAARPSPQGISGVLAPDGHGLSRRSLRYDGAPGPRAFVRDQLLNDFTMGATGERAVAELIGSLTGRGIEVALLPLPVTDDYVAQHPRGDADQAAFETALAALAERTGAALLEPPTVPASGFADTHHVNALGSELLTDALPELLAEAGLTRRC